MARPAMPTPNQSASEAIAPSLLQRGADGRSVLDRFRKIVYLVDDRKSQQKHLGPEGCVVVQFTRLSDEEQESGHQNDDESVRHAGPKLPRHFLGRPCFQADPQEAKIDE